MHKTGPTPQQVRAEVERLQAADREREAQREARMAELRKDARRHHEEKAALERQEKAEQERRREARRQAAEDADKRAMFNTWIAQGGAPVEFEAAWPDLRAQMLMQRTLEGENAAREGQRISTVSRI
jgi:membrane protein involved in colicin uptake